MKTCFGNHVISFIAVLGITLCFCKCSISFIFFQVGIGFSCRSELEESCSSSRGIGKQAKAFMGFLKPFLYYIQIVVENKKRNLLIFMAFFRGQGPFKWWHLLCIIWLMVFNLMSGSIIINPVFPRQSSFRMKTSFTLKDRLNHWTQGLKLCYVPLFLKHIVWKLLKMFHLIFFFF